MKAAATTAASNKKPNFALPVEQMKNVLASKLLLLLGALERIRAPPCGTTVFLELRASRIATI